MMTLPAGALTCFKSLERTLSRITDRGRQTIDTGEYLHLQRQVAKVNDFLHPSEVSENDLDREFLSLDEARA